MCIQEWIFELANWLSGAVFVCHMFLVFISLWKGSQYWFQCHLEHHYFSFLRWKVIEVSLHAWCCWSAGNQESFLKKDKNAKARYGEYQYVSTPTLTMSEFDPAFLAFIRCRILTLLPIKKEKKRKKITASIIFYFGAF